MVGISASYPVYSSLNSYRLVEKHDALAALIILKIYYNAYFKIVFLTLHTRPLFAYPVTYQY